MLGGDVVVLATNNTVPMGATSAPMTSEFGGESPHCPHASAAYEGWVHILSTGKRSNRIGMMVSTLRKILSYKDVGRKTRVASNNTIYIVVSFSYFWQVDKGGISSNRSILLMSMSHCFLQANFAWIPMIEWLHLCRDSKNWLSEVKSVAAQVENCIYSIPTSFLAFPKLW